MRCSLISSSIARNRASSLEATIPNRSGFDAATATHVVHAASMSDVEVLAGQRCAQQTTQRLAPTPLGTHRCPQRMNLAVPGNEPTDAALVPGAAPRLATGLPRKRPHGALVLEPVTMLVGALSTPLTAIQPRTTRATNNDELVRTPRTGPMSRARMRDDRHSTVVRLGCDTAVSIESRTTTHTNLASTPPTPDPVAR